MINRTSRRFIARKGFLFLSGILFPATLCTFMTWWFAQDWWQLAAFFWYSVPGNSFIWLPHEPAVIYAGTIYAPALVAIVGGVATTLASIIDHTIFTRVFQLEKMEPIKQTRLMRISVNLFNRQPWWTIVIFALTPIPFYPIRVLAPMANYPITRYVTAVVAGRIPRYFLLALGGAWANHTTWSFWPW